MPKSSATVFDCHSLSDTEQAANTIVHDLKFPSCVYLTGEMGAGKTTLSKYLISALGYQGAVTSPTYNLIQEYPVNNGTVYHMDLYRLDDPAELEYLALPDLWTEKSIFLIEWPERGAGYLPAATHTVELETKHQGEKIVKRLLYSLY